MSLSERLSEDLINALKARDKDRLSVVRMIKAAVKNKEIEKKAALSDEEVCSILKSLVRRGKDSIEQFSKANRHDLVEKETRELSIIQTYLPPELSEEVLEGIIRDAMTEVGAQGPGDMGRVMNFVMSKVKGQADGRVVSELVKKALTDGSRE